jgi:hypothetical protein
MGTLDVKARMEYAMCSHFLPNPHVDYCVGRLDKKNALLPFPHCTGQEKSQVAVPEIW